ncbi:MAG: hypothetical protein DWQ01_15385 [Planctomycetota bacterium]|nr:MAG: hypothetical protein DWQ01_15385 [Planctomycetota bacterium]
MCSVLLLSHGLPDSALAVYFIRDEYFDRAGGSPQALNPEATAFAPLEPKQGGSWFGFSLSGFVAGLVNRQSDPTPSAACSRGHLIREVLLQANLQDGILRLNELLRQNVYGGCRLFVGDTTGIWYFDLPAGSRQANAEIVAKGKTQILRHLAPVQDAAPLFQPRAEEDGAAWGTRMNQVVAAHQPEHNPLCVHDQNRGSLNTALIRIGSQGQIQQAAFGQGAPCRGSLEAFDWLQASQPNAGLDGRL